MPAQLHRTASRNAPTIRKRLIVVVATLLVALAITSTVLAAASVAAGDGTARMDLPVGWVQPQASLQMRVNYAHDWLGGDYELGHTFWLTVTESDGSTVKGTAVIDTVSGGGWGDDGFNTEPEHWSAGPPDIVPGDWAYFAADDGFTRTIQVGTISGTLDLAADSVAGPIYASFAQTLPVQCQPWGAWNAGMHDVPVKESEATPNGSVPFACSWAGEWDIVPGQDVAVLYIEPDGDMVIDVYRAPAPYLRVGKEAQGEPGEDGNVQFTLRYWNDGDAPAENVVLTDTLQGMAYLADTSSLSHSGSGPGPIVWDVGTVDPGTDAQFDLFVEVTASASEPVTNTVQIATSSPFDQGEPEEKAAQWTGEVVPNDTHLNVGKSAWTGDPAPDTDVVFAVNVCNNGSTGSSEVTLTDLLHPAMTLDHWRAQSLGWTELYSGTGELVVALPSLPGSSCSEVYLVAHVAPEVAPGEYLTNTAFITATNDLEPDDNEAFWEGNANGPHANLYVNKWWNNGQLVPGGELRYGIGYGNDGNVPVGSALITDTFPVSTTFASAWHSDVWGGYDFPPLILTDEYAVWEIPGLENGFGGDFEVLLAVDPGAAPDMLLLNTVEVTPLPGEDTYEDNSAEWAETLYPPGDPNLRVRKWHRWDGDGHLSYQVHFENVGTEPVGNVWITDTLPLDTQWDGDWHADFDPDRFVAFDYIDGPRTLIWMLSELYPGESGWLYFGANLDDPGAPLRWYINTVQITTPLGDPSPGDNAFEDIAFSGGEVRRLDLAVYGHQVWGEVSRGPITITTPHTQAVLGVDGDFWWESPEPLLPGQTITVAADAGLYPVEIAIPDPFDAEASSITDQVWGQVDHLDGAWLEIELQDGPVIDAQTDADGNYSAAFPDIVRGGQGEVRYRTLIDYAEVTFHREFRSPDLMIVVDYDHDWVGAEYEVGHTIYLTVTESDSSTIKSTALVDTPPGGGWWSTEWDQWSPQQPDIVPGDWVSGVVDGGIYTTEVQVGTIESQVDVDSDIVSGTLDIPGLAKPLLVRCEIHEEMAPEGIEVDGVSPDGGAFTCDFAGEWDIVPGQNVAVNYTEPDGDRVQAHPDNPAPYLRVEKWSDSQPAEGGNIAFTVRYRNEGGMAAESVVLTDTLEGMAYLGDTSGLPVTGSDPVVWDVGTVDPGTDVQFEVYVEVTAPPFDPVTNTLQIATSNPYDQGDPGEKSAQWTGEVAPNDTHLHVSKWAWTPNPAPDGDLVFQIDVCNDGSTASDEVLLTDTVHPSMTVGTWWAQEPGWQETYSDTGQLELAHPSIPSFHCSQVHLRVHLDTDAWPGMPITNTAIIYSDSDLDGGNETLWESQVGEPQANLYVDKSWANGQLVPGGQLHYNVQVGNDGNVAVGEAIVFTDALPAHTTFDSLWLHDQGGAHAVTPTLVGPDHVVWETPGLDNGYGLHFELVLNVHGAAPVGAVLTNTVEISCLPEEGCADNASTWVEMLYDHGPNLRVRKGGWWDDWGEDTRRASYWVGIENVGDSMVYDVAVTDAYPEAMELDGGIDAEWWRLTGWSDEPAGHYLTATFEYLGAGESTWLNFGAIAPGEGPLTRGLVLTNTVEVAGVPGEPNYDDNTDLVVLTTGPDLTVEKEWIGGQLLPGQEITYSLTFGNDRPGHEWWWGLQGDAWLTDTLPAHTAFVTATLRWCGEVEWCTLPPAVDDGTRLAWPLWPLGAGHRNKIHLTLRVLETIEAYDLLTNTVQIASAQPVSDAEPYLGNNVAQHVAMAVLPRFEVGKAYDSSRVAGTAVSYTLAVTNTGNDVGTSVVLSDVLPAGLTYGGSDGEFDGTAIRWEIPSIAAEGGVASGWFSATLGCALATVANDDYRVVASDQGLSSPLGPPVAFDVVSPSITLALTHTVGHVVVGDTVYMTGTAATDGTALSYTWDWGDGPVGGGLTAAHAYAWDDTYTVVLTATDACGYSDAVSATIDVAAPGLVPSFDQSATAIVVGSTVYFTDTTTTDGPEIVAWHWDLSDGGTGTSAGISHAYLETGTFAVTLTVTDALGYNGSAEGLVTVSAPDIVAGFDYSPVPAHIMIDGSIVFTDTTTTDGPQIVAWHWDFGDSEAGTGSQVSHAYLEPGTFTVTLTVTDALGYTAQHTAPGLVTVSDCVPLSSVSLAYAPLAPLVNVPVALTATVAPLDATGPITYEWDFGDGNTETTTAPSVVHAYTASGAVQATVTALNRCTPTGVSDQESIIIDPRRIYLPIVLRNH